jgi:hypothetical protein
MAYDVGFGDATVTLSLTDNGNPVSFSPVPEASTWAMMALGFAAFGGLARRKNRAFRTAATG